MAVAGAERTVGPSPSLATVRELAADHNLIPVFETFIDDCQTPVSAFLKLRGAQPGDPAFLLESADQGRVGRYSFIGYKPRKVLRWSRGDPGDPYALAAAELRRFSAAQLPELPPFAGGAVGMFAYDLVRTVEPLGEPNPDPVGLPDLALMLSDALVVFDHLKHTVTVIANVYAEDDIEASYRQATETIAEVRWRLDGPVPRAARPPVAGRVAPHFESNMSREQFEAMVARIIEYIYAGDAFQVVPSQRWSAPVPVQAFSIYRGLRAVNPSPYMYFLDFGDFEIAGASPEPLITVSGRRVSTRPIAGTRPRGADPDEDLRTGRRAAGRSEGARRARDARRPRPQRPWTRLRVRLGAGRELHGGRELQPRDAHRLERRRAAARRASARWMRCDRCSRPARCRAPPRSARCRSSTARTGQARRLRRCDRLGQLHRRADTCIHIRTVVVKDGVAHIQAGGGTVADAKPDYEFRESEAKARAVLQAIELAVAQPEWP